MDPAAEAVVGRGGLKPLLLSSASIRAPQKPLKIKGGGGGRRRRGLKEEAVASPPLFYS
jgi:hypothetical protein